MLFADDAIHDIKKWFASIKKKVSLKLQHFKSEMCKTPWSYLNNQQRAWYQFMKVPCLYRSKTCLWHQNPGKHPSQGYWNISKFEWRLARWKFGKPVFFQVSLLSFLSSGVIWLPCPTPPTLSISLIQSNSSFECRSALTARPALYHEEASFFPPPTPPQIFIFITV